MAELSLLTDFVHSPRGAFATIAREAGYMSTPLSGIQTVKAVCRSARNIGPFPPRFGLFQGLFHSRFWKLFPALRRYACSFGFSEA
jgi:hypothetical protein